MNKDNNGIDNDQLLRYDYDASKIDEDTMVEKHRRFPAQFLGASDFRGVRNQVYEILDNAWDECAEHNYKMKEIGIDFKSKILLEIRADDSVVVEDNGRGIPCGKGEGENEVPAIYKVFEREGAGGKARGGKGYTAPTAGQHGTGSAVVNSTSEYFRVVTNTATDEASGVYVVEYYKGKRVRELSKIAEIQYDGTIPITGTRVEYRYDQTIFSQTIDGGVADAFSREEIIERIKSTLYSLSGIDIEITFKFKDYDTVVMSPVDYSPIKAMDCKYNMTAEIEGEKFKSKIFIGIDETPHNDSSPFNTIVNRLLTTKAPADRMIRDCLSAAVGQVVTNWQVRGVEYIDTNRNYFLKYCKCFNIMSLENAQYSGQTKRELVSDFYKLEFNMRFTEYCKSEEFKPIAEFLASKYVEQSMVALENAEADRKRKEEIAKRKQLAEEQVEISQAIRDLSDPLKKKRFQEKVDGSRYEIAVKDCFQDKTEASLVIVEGKSVSSSLNSLAERRLPFAVCELGGKISNPYASKKNFATLDDIKSFIYNCLAENYHSILIMTDGDTDGLHMRMLVLAIMTICRDIPNLPDYIGERRVYIVNSPYSKMYIPEDCELNGKKYKQGTCFIPSFSETEELVNRKMGSIVRKYTGLSDIVSDLDPADLVTNPEYHLQVQPPSADELEMFENLMTRSHKVKKHYTLRRVTDRAIFTYNILNMSQMKVPREKLSRFPNNERPNLQMLDGAQFQNYTPAREYNGGTIDLDMDEDTTGDIDIDLEE